MVQIVNIVSNVPLPPLPGNGKHEHVIVDGVRYDAPPGKICSADTVAGLEGIRRDGTYVVVQMPEQTALFVGGVPYGIAGVTASLQYPEGSSPPPALSFFSGIPDANGKFAIPFPLRRDDLTILLMQNGDFVGEYAVLEVDVPHQFRDLGLCDLNAPKPPMTAFLPEHEGGPPSLLNSAEEEFPSFEFAYSGSSPAGFRRVFRSTINRSSGATAKFSWTSREYTSVSDGRYRFPAAYIGGFTSNVGPEETTGRILFLDVMSVAKTSNACLLYSLPKTSITTVKLLHPEGPTPTVGFTLTETHRGQV